MDNCTSCTAVESLGWAKASASGDGACVEVGNADGYRGCSLVHVRNSRFPGRVVDVPRERWQQLIAESRNSRQVCLADWFPKELYGNFAASFFKYEEDAFQSGVLNCEPKLVGSH